MEPGKRSYHRSGDPSWDSAMILVFARAGDANARALLANWTASAVQLVVPQDVMRPGWSLALNSGEPMTFATRGHAVDAAGVRGIVTLFAAIVPADCIGIRAEDRDYAAAEAQAFLLAWLHCQRAPKLNPPSLRALNGDPGHPLLWRSYAQSAGLHTTFDESSPRSVVTVIGRHVLGSDDIDVIEAARSFSKAVGLPLLGIEFAATRRGIAFVRATCTPDVRASARAFEEHFEAIPA